MIVWPENVLTRVVPLIGGGLCVPENKYLFTKESNYIFILSHHFVSGLETTTKNEEKEKDCLWIKSKPA
jgi:hypothetical protein